MVLLSARRNGYGRGDRVGADPRGLLDRAVDSIGLPRRLRVLIVGLDPLARGGLASILAVQPQLDVAGQVGVNENVALSISARGPDVVLWDLGADGGSSLDRLRGMDESGVPVLALAADEAGAAEALSAGARSALFRDADPQALSAALEATALGMVVLDQSLSPANARGRTTSSGPAHEPLTPRELEVLQWLAQGLSNKSVAERLKISEHTAKFHVNAILAKLGAQTRTEAVVRAVRLGLVLL